MPEDHRGGQRAADALDEARGDQHPCVCATAQSSDAAVKIARPMRKIRRWPIRSPSRPGEQQQAAEGDQVGVDDPGEVALREAEVVLDRGQRDVHDRRVEDDHQHARAEHVEREPAGAVGTWSLLVDVSLVICWYLPSGGSDNGGRAASYTHWYEKTTWVANLCSRCTVGTMSTSRTYGDACGIARALDSSGSALGADAVRELLLGPQALHRPPRRPPPPRARTSSPCACATWRRTGVVPAASSPRRRPPKVYELTERRPGAFAPVLDALGLLGRARAAARPRPTG